MSNAIVTENLNTGSSNWQLTNASATAIQGYTSAVSVDPGGSLAVYVSTISGGTTYTIDVYRLGYYGGLGGRLMLSVPGNVGVAQGYWDRPNKTLNNCPTAVSDSTTHLLEARWASSYTLNIPSNWVTGVYLLLFTDANGRQSYASFLVRGSASATYAVVRPNTVDQAYNGWGGYGLYTDVGFAAGVKATKVSFDRPTDQNFGSAKILEFELPLIKWLESQGYDLCYLSNIDVHATSGILNTHRACLSIGHDEYWSREMRDAWEVARDTYAIGLGFIGADTCDWQCRLESGGQNGANRTLTCYKVATSDGNLANDPFYGVDNTRVTAAWNDAVVNRPTATLVGLYYSGFTSNPPGFQWTVDSNASHPLLVGTGLTPGQSYGCNCVGYEWDKVQSSSPASTQKLASSATTPAGGGSDTSNTVVYVASSGALVFATGGIQWCWALDSYRYTASTNCTDAVVAGMQTLMANVMSQLTKTQKFFGSVNM